MENFYDTDLLIAILQHIAELTLIPFMVWLYIWHPLYLSKIKKYDSEMDKAVRMSKVWWFNVQPGYIESFIDKINYKIIRSDIINYIYNNLSNDEQRQYEELIKSSNYLEYIELREMQTNEKHEKIEPIERINVIYSIFLTKKRKDIYNDFFIPYKFKDEYFGDRVRKKIGLVSLISNEKLGEIGLLKYKLTNDKVLIEILDLLIEEARLIGENKLNIVLNNQNYQEMYIDFKISVIYSIFNDDLSAIYDSYFLEHPIVSDWKDECINEVKTASLLSQEELESYGLM